MQFLAQLFQLQSRFAPIPITIHIAFCIFATALFTILYIRHGKIADFLWLVVCDIPIILHWYGDAKTAYTVLGCEVILLALIFIEWLKERKAQKEAPKAEKTEVPTPEATEEKAENVEKAEEKPQEAEKPTEKAVNPEDDNEYTEMTWQEVYGEGKSVDTIDLERLDKEFGEKCKENAKVAEKSLADTNKIEVVLEAENVFSVEIPENEEK